ncbi:hypothetical protein ATI61_11499 [Archangium gephyra]|uniref:Uncharacterized protein n=1 Tax=Archangium gephyra TaxID=48 RepID=A0AAC8Q5E7_9BACT|nr:hypothetical protein [Archangium gephyra]AKJ01192.1 Hypothetical protein AA314_02818 [Archangium gephyra]REG24491.1 hypothetical protein ATI61_11499 [Archangium gephyra]
MRERNIHRETVKAWRDGRGAITSPDALVNLYERALDALWRRAHMSLGEITLMAIVDRVLHDGSGKFPHLVALKVETSGVQFGAFRLAAQGVDLALLEESLEFLVVELLRVFGTLTGEILTPGLHAELSKVRVHPETDKGGTP